METKEKIYKIEEFFWKNFIQYDGENPASTAGVCIPYTKAHIVKNATAYAEIDDGTINIANAMIYQYIKDKAAVIDCYQSPVGEDAYLSTISRLIETAFNLYNDNWFVRQMGIQKGFFLRDDIDNDNFKSSYAMLLRSKYEDPCHSPFVSQDQVWHLNPILYRLAEDGNVEAFTVAKNINEFIADNGYKIYNPYLSALVHFHTYCPSFNTDKCPVDYRQDDREDNFKYTIKVKRGAYNWYYSGGTKSVIKALEALDTGETPKYRSIRELCYKVIVFTLDRIYEPIYKRVTGSDFKHSSYYNYGATSGIWYSKKYNKRFTKRFNESIQKYNNGEATEVFEGNLAALVLPSSDNVDTDSLSTYLDNVVNNYYNDVVSAESDTSATEHVFSNPVELLTLWYLYNYLTNEA